MPDDDDDRFPFHRRRWWHEPPDEADPRTAEWRERMVRFRPGWWPENEPWPPHRRRWGPGARRPFLRRLGCLFMLVNLFGAALFVVLILLGLNALGITSIPIHTVRWIFPVFGVLIAATVAGVVAAGVSLRRVSIPLDDLLAASHTVAEGDYSVRVVPHGPPEVQSLAAAFNAMAEQLDAHERQRRSMLADVTHELRTPLTVIQGNLEGMLDGLYPADEARLRSILDETQVLSRLTDDLRTLSQAESGALQLRREPTDLVALTRDIVRVSQSQADEGRLRIELDAPENARLQSVDPERVRQVLTNLISNAVRYSPAGGAVRVQLRQDEQGTRISVSDSGSGIAPGDLPHVFDRYYKTADSRGMGLGLAIAKYIVEAHGGQIGAESQPGQGATIGFTLPG